MTDETSQNAANNPEAEGREPIVGANPLAKVPEVGTEIEAGRIVTAAKADRDGAWIQINGAPDWLPFTAAA
jgi:hypothetical protein